MSRTRRDIEVDHPVTIADASGRSFSVNLDPDRPDFVTDDGTLVWMHDAKGCRKVYRDADGNEVGPVQPHLAGAIVYARYMGWSDPSAPDWWNQECIEDVRAKATFRGEKLCADGVETNLAKKGPAA